MELDELIVAWKKQDESINRHLHNQTLAHLLGQKSQGALAKIRQRLTLEFAIIVIVFALFNTLFVVVGMPYTLLRWCCLGLFNTVVLCIIYYYVKTISAMLLPRYSDGLMPGLQTIVNSLNRFCRQYKLLNLPIALVCIVMFAGTQNLFVLIPWMVIEFLIWRAIILPKLTSRFEGYKADLEYVLRSLKDVK